MRTAGYYSPLGGGCERIYDVLHMDCGHFFGDWILVRPRNSHRAINWGKREAGVNASNVRKNENWRTIVRPSPLVIKSNRGIRIVRAIHVRPDPRSERRRLATRMPELDTNLGRLRVRKVDNPLERSDLRVYPKPQVLRAGAALRHDGGRFHENAAGAARRETLSAQVPVSAWL